MLKLAAFGVYTGNSRGGHFKAYINFGINAQACHSACRAVCMAAEDGPGRRAAPALPPSLAKLDEGKYEGWCEVDDGAVTQVTAEAARAAAQRVCFAFYAAVGPDEHAAIEAAAAKDDALARLQALYAAVHLPDVNGR